MDYPCIYELSPIFKAKVINRPSKECKSPYLADIRVITPIKKRKIVYNVMGPILMAHSPSLGCAGLVASSKKVYVIKNKNEKAKSKYSIYMAEVEEYNKKIVVGVNPNITNSLFESILKSSIFPVFKDYNIKREHTIGNSRIDFFLTHESKQKILIEVKNVCLAYYEDISLKELQKKDYSHYDVNSKIAIFPDCNRKIQKKPISPRAIKHIEELVEASQNGYKCYLVFIIQRTDCNYFSPSKLDKTYYKKLQHAYKNNFLDILPIQIEWIVSKAYFKKVLEFDSDFIH